MSTPRRPPPPLVCDHCGATCARGPHAVGWRATGLSYTPNQPVRRLYSCPRCRGDDLSVLAAVVITAAAEEEP